MENLYNLLPKDLVCIIEDYAKDRTNYDKVLAELNDKFINPIIISFTYDPNFGYDNHTIVTLVNLLQKVRDQRIRENQLWYDNVGKIKKPHGKRPPTIKTQMKKYQLRFGCKKRFRNKFHYSKIWRVN